MSTVGRARRVGWTWLVVTVLALAAGSGLVLTCDDGVRRESATAGSTPVRILEPEGVPRRSPTIVLAHGFAGSAAMMDPLGSALARTGHVVVLPELPGHGSNAEPLVEGALEPAVADAVALAAASTGQPVAVAGHSMGAGAVTSWAVDGGPEATVAISLPSAEDLPPSASRPPNLLLLWGSAEQQRFVDAASAALRLGDPDAVVGRTYGDPADGTARRAVEVAGAEHIAVVYRAQTAQEIAAWLGDGVPRGDRRLAGVVLVLLGGVLLVRPVLRCPDRVADGPDPPGAPAPAGTAPAKTAPAKAPARTAALPVLGWLLLAALAAGLGARALQEIGETVPVAVGGYLAAWFASGAVALLVVAHRRGAPVGTWRGAASGLLAGTVLAAALALPARVSWAGFALVGPRAWVLAGLLVVLGCWFWGEARVLSVVPGWRRGGLLLASRALVVAGLLGAVLVLGAPYFLVLTVPLVIPLLALLGVAAFWARDPLAAALGQAIPLALAVATTFPIVG